MEFSASLYRGVLPYSARHNASNIVDFPEPVGPVIAKIPAEQSGSSVKLISVFPPRDGKFSMRIDCIFMLNFPFHLLPEQPAEKVFEGLWERYYYSYFDRLYQILPLVVTL